MISGIANLLHDLPNDIRLKVLGNKKILENLKFWWRHSAAPTPSPTLKPNPANSSQKTCKSRYQASLALSSFIGCPYHAPNTLPRTVEGVKHLTRQNLGKWKWWSMYSVFWWASTQTPFEGCYHGMSIFHSMLLKYMFLVK